MAKKKFNPNDVLSIVDPAIVEFNEASSGLVEATEYTREWMCEPEFDVTHEDISRLALAVARGAELLQVLHSMKSLRELQKENAALRAGIKGKSQ